MPSCGKENAGLKLSFHSRVRSLVVSVGHAGVFLPPLLCGNETPSFWVSVQGRRTESVLNAGRLVNV